MQLREWLTAKFGGTGETVLDTNVYSDGELRKDIIKLEHRLEKLESEMDEHSLAYKQLVEEGAQASDLERKKYAQKAKFEKKKHEIKKKQYRANSLKLGTLLSIQGMREITDLQNQEGLTLDDAIEDADTEQLQNEIMEQMATFGVEMEDLQRIQNAIDVPILEDDLEVDISEEEQLMDQLAADEISAEEVKVDVDEDVGLVEDIDIDEQELEDTELET